MYLHKKPIVAWIMGHAEAYTAINRELEKRGIPVVNEVGKGARILAALTMRK